MVGGLALPAVIYALWTLLNFIHREVGWADLAMGIVALLSVYYSSDFALAVIFASSIYRVGCGIGHIRCDVAVRSHFGVVTYATEQPIRDSRCPAGPLRNLQRPFRDNIRLEQRRRARNNSRQFACGVKLQPRHNAEAIP